MNQNIRIAKSALRALKTHDSFVEKIFALLQVEFQKDSMLFFQNSSEEQISLYFYKFVLYNQVQNGGFLQLIFNGYRPYVFDSPLIDDLEKWGAKTLSDFLKEIKSNVVIVEERLKGKDKTLNALSALYKEHPHFEAYDQTFYQDDGYKIISTYVLDNYNKFIIVDDV